MGDRGMQQEIAAGIAMALALIPGLTVVPMLLAGTGMDFAGAYTACVLVTILATFLWGRACHRPLAAAPGAALASWLVYSVILSHGHSWQAVLGAVFLSSVLCLVFLWIFRGTDGGTGVPKHLAESLTAGLGLMLILLGLRQGHVIVSAPVGFFSMGDFSDPVAFHSMIGILTAFALAACRVSGAILWGMLITAVISFAEGFWVLPDAPFLLPTVEKTALQLDLGSAVELPDIVISLTILNLVLMQGTSLALRQKAEPKDAAVLYGTNLFGTLLGAFPLLPAIESAVGHGAGGQTGRTAQTAAGILGLFLFCEPLLASLASYGAVTAVPLVLAGGLLLRQAEFHVCEHTSEFFSACAVCILLPITQSIAVGFGTGMAFYVFLSVWEGRGKELSKGTLALTAVFGVLLFFLS